jgi:nucleoid-associated protein YgaU
MALEKLSILVETGQDRFEREINALFNPEQIGIQKGANWREAPALGRDVSPAQFTHGEPAVLSLDLFFDTYAAGHDVRRHTRPIFALTTIEQHGDLHRPPLCKLRWGRFTLDDFEWVLLSLNQRFTLFLPDGTPVRALLSCSFRQWRDAALEARLQNLQSADVVKTRTVRRGDTLSGIAAEVYQDATLWRRIAAANRISNPRRLKPGQVLVIPTLHRGRN